MTKGFVLWFTGLPCSGKSTLAKLLYEKLQSQPIPLEIFDGDVVRRRLTKELGFSKEDRIENIRRIAYVAMLLSRNGVGCIAAVISPYEAIRKEIRQEVPNYIEVFVDCPLEVCIERDVKGMYQKAQTGEIQNFTGVSAPYQPPTKPDLIIQTALESPEDSLSHIADYLIDHKYFPKDIRSN